MTRMLNEASEVANSTRNHLNSDRFQVEKFRM
jgi:hypothetical protein